MKSMILAVGSNGIAATTWVDEFLAKMNDKYGAGKRFVVILRRSPITAGRETSPAGQHKDKRFSIGRTTAGRCNNVACSFLRRRELLDYKSMNTIPADLRTALAADPNIFARWQNLTAIARRDFVSWITSAKQPQTRKRRIAIAVSKLAAGKRRPCCYAVVPMCLYQALGENPQAKTQWSSLSADERRDIADWVDDAHAPDTKKARALRACTALAAGKRGV